VVNLARRFENEYPYKGWGRITKKAWLRRKQLRLNMEDLKQRIPFYRLLVFFATVNMLISPMFWLFNAAFHIFTNDFWWFVLEALIAVCFWLSAMVYAWVRMRTPETMKIRVGHSNEFTAVGFVPGKHIIKVDLLESDAPGAKKEKIPVEAILCGGHEKVAETISPQKGPVIFARCDDPNEVVALDLKKEERQRLPMRSGVLKGRVYQIDRDPKPYLKGDVINYRFVDWGKEASDLFGKRVKDSTLIIVALDPLDPVSYEPPASEPGIYHELYAAKQRIAQLDIERLNYYKQDQKSGKAKRKQQDVVVSYGGQQGGER
jgi:hypothetical protein